MSVAILALASCGLSSFDPSLIQSSDVGSIQYYPNGVTVVASVKSAVINSDSTATITIADLPTGAATSDVSQTITLTIGGVEYTSTKVVALSGSTTEYVVTLDGYSYSSSDTVALSGLTLDFTYYYSSPDMSELAITTPTATYTASSSSTSYVTTIEDSDDDGTSEDGDDDDDGNGDEQSSDDDNNQADEDSSDNTNSEADQGNDNTQDNNSQSSNSGATIYSIAGYYSGSSGDSHRIYTASAKNGSSIYSTPSIYTADNLVLVDNGVIKVGTIETGESVRIWVVSVVGSTAE